jgi:hypothetical protein
MNDFSLSAQGKVHRLPLSVLRASSLFRHLLTGAGAGKVWLWQEDFRGKKMMISKSS